MENLEKISSMPLKILDAAVWFVTIGITLFYIFYWNYMPEQVPMHWNGAGVIDDYADAGVSLLLYMLWWCDLIIEVLFAYIIVSGVFVRNLGAWFLPAVFAALTVDFIWFFIKMRRLKEKIRKERIGQKTGNI